MSTKHLSSPVERSMFEELRHPANNQKGFFQKPSEWTIMKGDSPAQSRLQISTAPVSILTAWDFLCWNDQLNSIQIPDYRNKEMINVSRDFPSGPVVKTAFPLQGAWVWYPVRELWSFMPHSTGKNTYFLFWKQLCFNVTYYKHPITKHFEERVKYEFVFDRKICFYFF